MHGMRCFHFVVVVVVVCVAPPLASQTGRRTPNDTHTCFWWKIKCVCVCVCVEDTYNVKYIEHGSGLHDVTPLPS